VSKSHGKKTAVLVGGVELTAFSNNSQLQFTPDNHDTTTYGKNSHVFSAGLLNGKGTVSGFYDTTLVTGPRAVLMPLLGVSDVAFVHRPEGTGSGLPQDAVNCVISNYTQTHPVADMVTWSLDIQFSDDVNSTPQP
jgi:hypothetical protein